ncbi:MAG TPA: TetR/AcrR family transcriptional regulator [Caulobacteraceae bacterium]
MVRKTGPDGSLGAGPDRRSLIVQALHRCIREKGYASTSLTDVAVRAKMSPSHIRYYFDGKDAILEYYLDLTCQNIVRDIRSIDEEDPFEWLRRFVEYYIHNPRISAVGLGVMVEIFGLSVHQPRLREIKTAYDDEIRAVLTEFFQRAASPTSMAPAMAAEIVQALEAGLKYNAVFEKRYDPERATAAFLGAIQRLLGLTGSAAVDRLSLSNLEARK